MIIRPSRRGLLIGAAAALAGCDQLQRNQSVTDFIRIGESLSKGAQRVFLSEQPLAREFKVSDLSPTFRANGTMMPAGDDYAAHVRDGFRNWRLSIDGMVARPAAYSMDQLRAMTSRTQITRHDCVEGWSAIGQWTGVPLWSLLALAQIQPGARYVVFHCADKMYGDVVYYESIDLFDAVHPQTMLAYELNGKPLPVANGAPLRLRIERQLGYKQAKYVQALEVVNSLAKFGGGRGGYWEDRGYEWYGGI
ncbi:MAG: molybdopterin-binding protein [Alphaproteobacteria bacterium]